MKRLFVLLLVLSSFIAGCGGGGSSTVTQPLTPGDELELVAPGPGASVDGRLTGAASLPVEVVDRQGNVLQTGVTDPSGYFRFDNLPTGLLLVRVAGQTLPFSSFPAAFLHLGQPFPITRQQAAALATGDLTEVTITGTMTPLPPGTVVGASDGAEVRTTGEEWFFLVNLIPNANFRHHVEFVFVDARTGEMIRSDQQSYPTLNGHGYWGSDFDYFDYPGFDPENPDAPVQAVASPEVVTAISAPPSARAASRVAAKHNVDAESVFAVLIQASGESGSEADIVHMFKFFSSAGVPANYVNQDAGNVQVVKLDGDSPEDARSRISSAVSVVNEQIRKRHGLGKHSTLFIYLTGHGGNGDVSWEDDQGEERSIRARAHSAFEVGIDEVGITRTLACRVRFIIDACDTEQLCRDLKLTFDPLEHDFVAMGAASAGEPSGYNNLYFNAISGGKFTNAIIDNGRIAGGDLLGIARDDFTVSTDRYLAPLQFLGFVKDPKSKLEEPQHPCLFLRPKEPAFCHQPKLAAVSLDFSNSVSIYDVDEESTQKRETRDRIAPNAEVPGSPFVAGQGPNHVTVTPDGRFLYTADDRGNTVSGFQVAQDGSLQPVPGSPYATQVFPSFDLVDPSGQFLYVSNFGANSITGFRIDPAAGSLTELPGSPFPAGRNPGHLAIHPLGRLLFVANGGDDNVSVLTLDPATGALADAGVAPGATGSFPRNVTIDPSGRYLYTTNVGSGTVSGFALDSQTGALTPVPGSPFATGPNPQRIAIDPEGRWLYVSNFDSGDVSGYALNPDNGGLTPLAGFPVVAGQGAAGIAADGSELYVTCLLGNTVVSFAVDQDTGALQVEDTVAASGGPSSIFLFEAPESTLQTVLRRILSRDEWCGSL